MQVPETTAVIKTYLALISFQTPLCINLIIKYGCSSKISKERVKIMEVKITFINVMWNPNLLSTYYKPDVVIVSFCVVLI